MTTTDSYEKKRDMARLKVICSRIQVKEVTCVKKDICVLLHTSDLETLVACGLIFIRNAIHFFLGVGISSRDDVGS